MNMSKKNFSGGINSLLDNSSKTKAKRGRPRTQTKEIIKTSQIGTKDLETRATFIVNEELLDKIKAIAYWDRLLIKDVLNAALEDVVIKYEKKNGAIKPIPKK